MFLKNEKRIFFKLQLCFSFLLTNSQELNDETKKSLLIIEEVPVYPGCKGNNDDLKICFSKSIQKFFAKNFDSDLPNRLNLNPGAIKVFIFFKINKEGDIDCIKVNAPHPELVSTITNVMSKLPKMIPAKIKQEPVNVKYSIPFTMVIEETRAQKKARRKMEKNQ